MQNIGLFIISAVIWGSTWLMITFQLGVVEPIISVIYRFGLASLILFSICLIKKKSFRFEPIDQFLILLQGLLLFGFNYWLTYLSISHINSALAAVLSTSIVYFNVVFAKVFLGDEIRNEVLVGATVGVLGIVLIFMPELEFSGDQNNAWYGISLLLLGSVFASLGNIVSAKTQRRKIPVLQANALGMGYASLFIGVIALISGYQFSFDASFSYIGSLLYLALFGSVIAFGAFLTLLGRIGPDKAGYVTLVYPVIAMILSTFFENYQWTLEGLFGLLAILLGNFIAMGKYKNLSIYQRLRNNKT
ncbi:DMT family transporter [Aliikangiella coralliicola]|uniref:EamA family transporter n=1 Tax=Aliikangiella coralliicola TaxID=2592383 RepID=A0A545U6E9_9GAMM|nr:EamA family transporter [Aliikangiella coralliicola]TQV85051.1 EamA family transporter [Aliikangiella coralliicola]